MLFFARKKFIVLLSSFWRKIDQWLYLPKSLYKVAQIGCFSSVNNRNTPNYTLFGWFMEQFWLLWKLGYFRVVCRDFWLLLPRLGSFFVGNTDCLKVCTLCILPKSVIFASQIRFQSVDDSYFVLCSWWHYVTEM